MCRFAAYIGRPLLLNNLVSKPADSLIKQSLSAKETDIKLNADGFGIGWYNPEACENPAIYASILPAWNDPNLINISHSIISPCFFGHVRAAEVGGVSYYNCHPFTYGKYMFMHNGSIGGFHHIKLQIYNLLDEKIYRNVKGQTDSEAMFGLWLTNYLCDEPGLDSMLRAWRETLLTILQLQHKASITEASYINVVVTDGKLLVALKYCTEPKYSLTLHYSAGKEFVYTKNGYYMLPNELGNLPSAIIVASERISVHKKDWHDVPPQNFFTVDEHKNYQLTPIDL